MTEAADGILRIAATAMSYAVKGVTTERGLDAGDFTLFAYGGAGPLHAVQVAREIGIRKVIIPGAPGVFSAFGMLFSDLRYDFVRTWPTRLDDAPFEKIEQVYRELEERAGRRSPAHRSTPQKVTVKRAADMRYVGQEHAVTVDLPMQCSRSRIARQSSATSTRCTSCAMAPARPNERAEIVSLRTTVAGLMRKPPPEKIGRGGAAPPKPAFTGRRPVYVGGRFVETPTFQRSALLAGNRIDGPALIEEHASTTVLMPGDELKVDAYGNLVITVGKGR